jgi:hypothetical protein
MSAAKAKQRIHDVSGMLQRESDVSSLCKGIMQYKCVPMGVTNKSRYKAVLTYLMEAA